MGFGWVILLVLFGIFYEVGVRGYLELELYEDYWGYRKVGYFLFVVLGFFDFIWFFYLGY